MRRAFEMKQETFFMVFNGLYIIWQKNKKLIKKANTSFKYDITFLRTESQITLGTPLQVVRKILAAPV